MAATPVSDVARTAATRPRTTWLGQPFIVPDQSATEAGGGIEYPHRFPLHPQASIDYYHLLGHETLAGNQPTAE
ncbi:hypothetical protein OPV22_020536 [Ensete ventricosum]|uniref:Uncharacterized protein n=1 Tax=Ensete ventricosum TaxID=4639 RepID=A0AAV8QAN7_ENSVE|nr:hypothetical protein OPV22_020536 [Ensete ventricosum]